MKLSDFFKTDMTAPAKRREKAAEGPAPEPKPEKQPDPGSFFYDSPAELRKKAGKK